MSSSVCPLPKLRKQRLGKHSVTTGSVMLMFCHLVIAWAWKARSVMLMFCYLVIAWKAIWNRRICGKNLSQVNYTLSSGYALETTEPATLTLYFIIGWSAYLDSEAFDADKGKKDHSTYNVFGDWDDKESEEIEDDQAEESRAAACCWLAWALGGRASNTRRWLW